jgi:hypothetical protein
MIMAPWRSRVGWVAAALAVFAVVLTGCARQALVSPQPTPTPGEKVVALTDLSPERLRTGIDSLVIRFGDLPEGSHRLELREVDGGYSYTEQVILTENLWRSVMVSFDRTFGILSVTSSGAEFGRPMGGVMSYDKQKAKGTAWVLRDGVPTEIAIETTLPEAAFDGDVLLAILPALEWAIGDTYKLRLFDSASGSVSDQTLYVVGEESITIPAGEFVALRGELTTTQLPVTVWVTQEVPRRILKLASANGETVLTK